MPCPMLWEACNVLLVIARALEYAKSEGEVLCRAICHITVTHVTTVQ